MINQARPDSNSTWMRANPAAALFMKPETWAAHTPAKTTTANAEPERMSGANAKAAMTPVASSVRPKSPNGMRPLPWPRCAGNTIWHSIRENTRQQMTTTAMNP